MSRSIQWAAIVATAGVVWACGISRDRLASADLTANLEGDRQRGMRNCPSALAGATTTWMEARRGVDVEIRGDDAATVTRIRELARKQAAAQPVSRGDVEHTGRGTGRGSLGACPIVHVATDITVEDIDGGARVLVRAKRYRDIYAVRALVVERVDAVARAR